MFSILIVDDEATERDGLSFLLKEHFSFSIQKQPNGKQAWEAMQREAFDVLLTDVKMPFMDGLELSQLVSEYFPDTVIVIVSAHSEFEYAKRAMQAKAVHYLLKPIEIDEFITVMKHVWKLCEEIRHQRLQQTHEKQNLKQLTLMRLLSGDGKQTQKDVMELQRNGLTLSDHYLRLLHLETQSDYFSVHYESFEKLVEACCHCESAFVSFYPHSLFLLLISDSVIHSEMTAEVARRLCRNILQLHGQAVSIFISACIHGPDCLSAEAAALSRMRKKIYSAQDSILFIHEHTSKESPTAPEIEAARSALEIAIERRNVPQIHHHLHLFFNALKQCKIMNSPYLIHMLYDLATRIYIRFDRYHGKALAKHMDSLLDLPYVEQMEKVMGALVDSLSQGEEEEEAQEASQAVKRVLRIIRREYAAQLSLDYLAQRVGVTPAYLSYLFKHETGETLVKYLTEYRLKQARLMLEEGSVKVNQVAKACGYENASYFNRLFKTHFGVTPSAIRGQEE